MRYLLTLDVGTTAVKVGLFSEKLDLVSFAIQEYSLLTPKLDHVELKPETYWENIKKAIGKVLFESKVVASQIVSITCTTQGETFVPVGLDGKNLSSAIVWLDSRAKSEAEDISKKFDKQTVYSTTGLPEINGYCPIAKILWIKNNFPALYVATHKFLLLEDYLIYRLSGRYVTNPSLMCSTGYFNINTDKLWGDMLEFCCISPDKFPEILRSGSVVGEILPEIASEFNLSPKTIITTGAMDQVASAIGSGNISEGTVTETTGTAQVVAASYEKEIPKNWSTVTIYRHAVENCFLKIVINQTAGMAYKWFRNEFCIDLMDGNGDAFDLMGELAGNEPILSRGVTFFPHLTGMQFPHSDESLRGVFLGIGLNSNRGCFIRSILEGVGYMLRESIEEMHLDPDCIISLGGGAKSQLWSQIKADICGTTIVVLENEESTSLGAAIMGCIALGIFNDYEVARDHIARKQEFTPNAENHGFYGKGYAEYRDMYATFSPIFQKRK
jgi:xylulokinase